MVENGKNVEIMEMIKGLSLIPSILSIYQKYSKGIFNNLFSLLLTGTQNNPFGVSTETKTILKQKIIFFVRNTKNLTSFSIVLAAFD